MKAGFLGLLGAPLMLMQCQPTCAPAPPPPGETTTTTAVTTTTTTPSEEPVYTATVSCAPLGIFFDNLSEREIVEQGFGPGPTPMVVIGPGESVFVEWNSYQGEDYVPLEAVTWRALFTDTEELIDEPTVVLADVCPDGWE